MPDAQCRKRTFFLGKVGLSTLGISPCPPFPTHASSIMHPRDIQADLQIAKSCVFFFLLPGSLGQTLLPASLETNDKPNALSEMEALETAVAVCLSVCLSVAYAPIKRPPQSPRRRYRPSAPIIKSLRKHRSALGFGASRPSTFPVYTTLRKRHRCNGSAEVYTTHTVSRLLRAVGTRS